MQRTIEDIRKKYSRYAKLNISIPLPTQRVHYMKENSFTRLLKIFQQKSNNMNQIVQLQGVGIFRFSKKNDYYEVYRKNDNVLILPSDVYDLMILKMDMEKGRKNRKDKQLLDDMRKLKEEKISIERERKIDEEDRKTIRREKEILKIAEKNRLESERIIKEERVIIQKEKDLLRIEKELLEIKRTEINKLQKERESANEKAKTLEANMIIRSKKEGDKTERLVKERHVVKKSSMKEIRRLETERIEHERIEKSATQEIDRLENELKMRDETEHIIKQEIERLEIELKVHDEVNLITHEEINRLRDERTEIEKSERSVRESWFNESMDRTIRESERKIRDKKNEKTREEIRKREYEGKMNVVLVEADVKSKKADTIINNFEIKICREYNIVPSENSTREYINLDEHLEREKLFILYRECNGRIGTNNQEELQYKTIQNMASVDGKHSIKLMKNRLFAERLKRRKNRWKPKISDEILMGAQKSARYISKQIIHESVALDKERKELEELKNNMEKRKNIFTVESVSNSNSKEMEIFTLDQYNDAFQESYDLNKLDRIIDGDDPDIQNAGFSIIIQDNHTNQRNIIEIYDNVFRLNDVILPDDITDALLEENYDELKSHGMDIRILNYGVILP